MKTNPGKRLLYLAALGSALHFCGCDSGSTGPAPTGGNTHGALIDACTLVTKAEAEAILGKAVLTTKSDTTSAYITNCTYEGSVDSTYILPSRLSVTAFTTAGVQAALSPSMSAASHIAALKTQIAAADRDSVAGVGTDAIWEKKPGRLEMYKGDVTASLIYSPHGKALDTSAVARAGATQAGIDVAAKL